MRTPFLTTAIGNAHRTAKPRLRKDPEKYLRHNEGRHQENRTGSDSAALRRDLNVEIGKRKTPSPCAPPEHETTDLQKHRQNEENEQQNA
jgi:hypothetical protein